jgi:hypothetical protein
MKVDLLHLRWDGLGGIEPCGQVALTLQRPPGIGEEIKPELVAWPWAKDKALVRCGTCGGYAGECLRQECARPHRHVLLLTPDHGQICRAGCLL